MTDQDALERDFQETINALVRPAVTQVAQDVDRCVGNMRHEVKEYRDSTSRHIDDLADEVRGLKSQVKAGHAEQAADLQGAVTALTAELTTAGEQMRAALQQASDVAHHERAGMLEAVERSDTLLQDTARSVERLHIRWSEDAAALESRLVRMQAAIDATVGSVHELRAASSDAADRSEKGLRLLDEAVRALPQAQVVADQHSSMQREVSSLRASWSDAETATRRAARMIAWLLGLLLVLSALSVAGGAVLLGR